MSEFIYVDGKYFSKDDAKVSVFDHGYLYGDGVFEGIRFYNLRIFRFDEHMKRLYESAKTILLEIPLTYDEFKKAIKETVRKSGFTDGYLRVVVSRGIGDLGLDTRRCQRPTVVIIPAQLKLYPQEAYDNGMSIITVATRRAPSEVLNPRVKSLNYLNNIMAKIEAFNVGYDEAIMLNQEGFVAECTADNVFYIKNKVICTPATCYGSLKGVTRDFTIELGRKLGLEVVEGAVTRLDLYTSDEMFITGTACEVMPIIKMDGRVIGSGKPGDITMKLITNFREIVKTEGEAV